MLYRKMDRCSLKIIVREPTCPLRFSWVILAIVAKKFTNFKSDEKFMVRFYLQVLDLNLVIYLIDLSENKYNFKRFILMCGVGLLNGKL